MSQAKIDAKHEKHVKSALRKTNKTLVTDLPLKRPRLLAPAQSPLVVVLRFAKMG